MPKLENICRIELFYTDQEDYHYQETVVDSEGNFSIDLKREGELGKMYLRASDGLGNYANACDILKTGKVEFDIVSKVSNEKNTNKAAQKKKSFSIAPWLLIGVFFIMIGIFLKVQKMIRKEI